MAQAHAIALQANAPDEVTRPTLQRTNWDDVKVGDFLTCIEHFVVRDKTRRDGGRDILVLSTIRGEEGKKESFSNVSRGIIENEYFNIRANSSLEPIVLNRTALNELIEGGLLGEQLFTITFRKVVKKADVVDAITAFINDPANLDTSTSKKAKEQATAIKKLAAKTQEGELRPMTGTAISLDAKVGRLKVNEVVLTRKADGSVDKTERQERVADLRTIERLEVGGRVFVVSTTKEGRDLIAARKKKAKAKNTKKKTTGRKRQRVNV